MSDEELLETLRSTLGSELRRANEVFTHFKLNGLLEPLLLASTMRPIAPLRQRALELAGACGWFTLEEPAFRRSLRLTDTGAAAL